jgi:hypothetical protein
MKKPMANLSAITDQPESRIGKKAVSAYFEPEVAKALKGLALELDTTMQGLMALAFNDLLEKHGRGRPADETVLPRGGASHKRG